MLQGEVGINNEKNSTKQQLKNSSFPPFEDTRKCIYVFYTKTDL